jgi:branched-chain amino acid aminotransferase
MPDPVSLNGRVLPSSGACIPATDRGFLLGDGLFETIRIRERGPVALDRHLARLAAGLKALGFGPLPFDPAPALADLLKAGSVSGGVARLTVSRGSGPRGVLPPETPALTVLITAAAMAPIVSPARLIVARGTRRNQHSPLSRLKTMNYGDSILARQEAEAALADDAILRNTDGNVAETSAANLVFRFGDAWVTPPVADGALPGTARARLLDAGLVSERRVTASELVQAEAGFVVSALTLRPIAAIDSRNLTAPGTEAFVAFSDVLEM